MHMGLGGKIVEFAGYRMPLHYQAGILREHLHTRAAASVFDVSHMGQIVVRGDDPARALETLVAGDLIGLAQGRMRYTFFTNTRGGILDDLIVTNVGDYLFLVVNGVRKIADIEYLKTNLPAGIEVELLTERALIALQGPKAANVISKFAPGAEHMRFMTAQPFKIHGSPVAITRSGYTGEDGYEISIPSAAAESITECILAEKEVEPAGLGARDSLRLEAGLCLYGHDIDETTTPVEAALTWSISKRRRSEGGFPGAKVVQRQIAEGVRRIRVGIAPDGKVPAREGAVITDNKGKSIGSVTSGGFGPSFGGPVGMGYINPRYAFHGTHIKLMVRGRPYPGRVVNIPLVPNRYFRGKEQTK